MNSVGERLYYARKNNGYTQESLGQAIGVSRGVIYNIEQNITRPRIVVINAICKTLKVNKNWLLNGTGEMELKPDASQSPKILAELYSIAKELSEDEQLFLLDTIKSLKVHLRKNQE